MELKAEHVVAKYILVGVDETSESLVALHWAVDTAVARELPVRVVRARLNDASRRATTGRDGADVAPAAHGNQQAELDAAVEFARDRLGGDRAAGWLADLALSDALVLGAAESEMIVVAGPSRNRVSAAVLGSDATTVSVKPPCPVVVVRGERRSGPIVVGIDGTPEAESALAFAFEEADRSGEVLEVVHCWRPQPVQPSVVERTEGLLIDWLNRSIEPYRTKFPAATVHASVIKGRARTRLIERSSSASMIVVGTRRRRAVAGLVLGSVSQSLVHHANAPVAIIP